VTSKTKRVLITCAVAAIYYIAFFTIKLSVNQNLYYDLSRERVSEISISPANYQISENCLIVRGQATTGPHIRVVEGAEFLTASVPIPHPDDLNVQEIEMTGASIYSSFLEYPDYFACDWLIYGKVTGTTDQYAICGSGTIPVFQTEKVQPIMTLAEFLTLEAVMFDRFPLGLIGACYLYFWPLWVMVWVRLADIRKKKRLAKLASNQKYADEWNQYTDIWNKIWW